MHVFTSTACLEHDSGAGYPERPARLAAVLSALHAMPAVTLTESAPASLDPIRARHDSAYLDRVAEMSARGSGDFGADTQVGPHTWSSTLAASGAALEALGYALSTNGPAFAAIRPPGHHALRNSGMGFCLVNHIAVLASEARRNGRERVLIIDWDVHHGNGTQAMVKDEPLTRFVSMHQWPWYPGTGAVDERGCGNCFNVPLAAGHLPEVYVEALWAAVVTATRDWRPDVVLVSAGYDGMQGDPLGGFTLEPQHYAEWTVRLRDRFSGVPIVGLMEGGYVPSRLAAGVVATVQALG